MRSSIQVAEGHQKREGRKEKGGYGEIAGTIAGLATAALVLVDQGLPWSGWGIALVGILFIALITALVSQIARHRSEAGRKPLAGKYGPWISAFLITMALVGVAGFARGSDRTSGQHSQSAHGAVGYARKASAVLRRLKRTTALAYANLLSVTDPVAYEREARRLARRLHEAAVGLGAVEVDGMPREQNRHLQACLSTIGDDYLYLAWGARHRHHLLAARRRIAGDSLKLHSAEEALQLQGYHVALPMI